MKILFISLDGFSNNTSSVIQNKGIVQGLHNLGHSVDVLTLEPVKSMVIYDESMNDMANYINHTYYIPLNNLYIKLAGKQKSFVEKTGKESSFKSYLKGKIRMLIKSVLIYDIRALNVTNIKKLNLNPNDYDVIISASDPKSTHYVATKIVKRFKYKGTFIQYWGDPLYLDITRIRGPFDFLYKWAEKALIEEADKVIYATPFTLREQQNLYPNFKDRMTYVYQVPPYGSFGKGKRKSDYNEIVYCGDYRSTTRNIIPLYQSVKEGSDDLHLTICGTSNIKLDSGKNISVKGQVNHKTAQDLESNADILISICNLKGSQIPGKIYYLCAYDTPIVIILDGEYKEELREYFEQFDRFICCENNKEDISEAIKEAQRKKSYDKPKQLTPEHIASQILK